MRGGTIRVICQLKVPKSGEWGVVKKDEVLCFSEHRQW